MIGIHQLNECTYIDLFNSDAAIMNEVLQLGLDALVAAIFKLEETIKGDYARGTKGAMTCTKSIKNVV